MRLDLKIPKLPKIGVYHYLSIIIFIGLLNTSVGYAYFEARNTEITLLHIEGAPENMVFIADPHLKDGNIEHTRTIISEINALHPSIVLIGGDFVYGDGDNLSLQEVWRGIDAPVYAVLGNHDYKSGVTPVTWVEKNRAVGATCFDAEVYDAGFLRDNTTDLPYANLVTTRLEENGVTVLRNEYIQMNIQGTNLLIVGIDDGWAGMADPPDVPETDAFCLYMIHEPECRSDWDSDLILAGHTHGGQFLPQSTPIPGFELSGLGEEDGIRTYITRGTGTSNLGVELRLFATPEIVIINPTESPEHIFPDKTVVHLIIGE
jgi:hypothetical protein